MQNAIIATEIKFKKLNHDKLKAIVRATTGLTYDLAESKVDQAITKALMMQIWFKLQNLSIKNKKQFTLTMSNAEAACFWKVFNRHLRTLDTYDQAIITQILTQIESQLL